jgi:hypothetical protein
MKRIWKAVLAGLFVAAIALPATAAQAVTTVQKATGSIVMANPKQAITFDVFETNPVKGNVTYTNFEYADPGSGVWVPGSAFAVTFGVDPSTDIVSTYDFTIASTTPLSPTSLSFTGNGVQQVGGWHGPVTGTISGSTLNFKLIEQNDADPLSYTLNATGTIDANGVITLGTWNDNYGGLRTGTFNIADVGDEVFSFTTAPTCVDVTTATNPKVALFGYTIPAGAPAELAGQPVAVKVTDKGQSGPLNDTYEHDYAAGQGSCLPLGGDYQPQYPITAGNLTVFN